MSSLILFLDENSKRCASLERTEAIDVIKGLISVIRKLRKINSDLSINCEKKFSEISICDTWTVQSALGGQEFRDEWDYLRALKERTPLIQGVECLEENLLVSECMLQPGSIKSNAAHYAHLLETATISLKGEPTWDDAYLVAKLVTYNQQNDAIEESDITIRNSNRTEHVDIHSSWLNDIVFNHRMDIKVWWPNRATIFNRLTLLDLAKEGLLTLGQGTIPYYAAMTVLSKLNHAAQQWEDASKLPNFETRTTPESYSRQDLCEFYDETSGKNESFEWHSRFTGNYPGRIHFRLDKNTLKIIVAYIGKKLE